MRAGDPGVRDSEDILSIPRLPESLLVVGAGAVGCEYASIVACLGVRVTLACRTDRVLDRMDADSSRVLAESFNGLGIRVVPRAEVVSLAREGDRLVAGLAGGSTLAAEMVLVATGRKAATEGLGLEEAGVELRADGSVKVDERYETTAAGVYAAGDVIGTPALAAAAMEEARVAVCHAFGFAFKQAVDGLVPSYVFSIPEVASVGMSEDEARRAGIDIEVGQAAFSANARARISGFADGLLKLVFRASDRRLVGVHIVGEMASELIHLGQMVLREGQGLGRFIETTFAVPTRSEAYKYAAYDGLMRLARRGRERRAGGG
jgi:NAD(P) transhydrogenase